MFYQLFTGTVTIKLTKYGARKPHMDAMQLVRPIKTPAWFGATSMWLTYVNHLISSYFFKKVSVAYHCCYVVYLKSRIGGSYKSRGQGDQWYRGHSVATRQRSSKKTQSWKKKPCIDQTLLNNRCRFFLLKNK
jgi:hypothetical protein